MPIVCINRPNRSKKRTWTPRALTRIVEQVCERYGQERTEDAVQDGYCGEEKCRKIVKEVLTAIASVIVAMEIVAVLEKVLEVRALRWLLRRTAAGRALMALMEVLRITIPNFAAKQAEIAALQIQLRTYLRTGGKVWMGKSLPPEGF